MRSPVSFRSVLVCASFSLLVFVQAVLGVQLTVAWDDNSTGETGFKVERSSDGVTFAPLATVNANVTAYCDANVAAGSTYWYRVCAFAGTTLSAYSNPTSASTTAILTPTNPPAAVTSGRLERISVRAVSGPWGSAAITGSFTVDGSAQQILLRAVGPGLRSYSSATLLADPKLTVTSGGSVVASNDNWGGSSSLMSTFDQVGAFPLNKSSKDAAILATFVAGSFSMNVTGQREGLALAEIFDAESTASPAGRLTRLQMRAPVGSGDEVMVAGLTISGDTPLKLLVRAVGPSLIGVQGVLANPKLQIFRGGSLVKENDDWGGSIALRELFAKVNASGFSATSKDAAMDVSLTPGNYTVVISGVNGTKGLGRFDAYVLP
jgi:hypothetical protein